MFLYSPNISQFFPKKRLKIANFDHQKYSKNQAKFLGFVKNVLLQFKNEFYPKTQKGNSIKVQVKICVEFTFTQFQQKLHLINEYFLQ